MANSKSASAKTRKGRMTAKQFAKANLKGLGIVAQIVKLAKKGYEKSEIIAAGYNKNTVYRQVREQVANA